MKQATAFALIAVIASVYARSYDDNNNYDNLGSDDGGSNLNQVDNGMYGNDGRDNGDAPLDPDNLPPLPPLGSGEGSANGPPPDNQSPPPDNQSPPPPASNEGDGNGQQGDSQSPSSPPPPPPPPSVPATDGSQPAPILSAPTSKNTTIAANNNSTLPADPATPVDPAAPADAPIGSGGNNNNNNQNTPNDATSDQP